MAEKNGKYRQKLSRMCACVCVCVCVCVFKFTGLLKEVARYISIRELKKTACKY